MSAAWSGHAPVLGALPRVDVNSVVATFPRGGQHDAQGGDASRGQLPKRRPPAVDLEKYPTGVTFHHLAPNEVVSVASYFLTRTPCTWTTVAATMAPLFVSAVRGRVLTCAC